MAGFGSIRPRPAPNRQAAQARPFEPLVHPVAITEHCVIGDQIRLEPLVHPVAITEHCVIGDQIRLPAAWCDMPGCGAAFADPAALGETDNRARAARAGWARDECGRLICPACQQGEPQAPGGARPGHRSPRLQEALPSVTRLPEALGGFRRDTGGEEQAKPVARPPEPIPAIIA